MFRCVNKGSSSCYLAVIDVFASLDWLFVHFAQVLHSAGGKQNSSLASTTIIIPPSGMSYRHGALQVNLLWRGLTKQVFIYQKYLMKRGWLSVSGSRRGRDHQTVGCVYTVVKKCTVPLSKNTSHLSLLPDLLFSSTLKFKTGSELYASRVKKDVGVRK